MNEIRIHCRSKLRCHLLRASSILPKDLEGMVSKAEKEGRIPLRSGTQIISRFLILLNQAIKACSIAYHLRTNCLRHLKSDHPFHGISESLSVPPINASCTDVHLEGPRITEVNAMRLRNAALNAVAQGIRFCRTFLKSVRFSLIRVFFDSLTCKKV